MKKSMLSLVMALTLIAPLTGAVEAGAKPARACIGWQYKVKHSTPHGVRERRIKRLIRCVFAKVGIPGQVATAYVIAYRESGYAPWAHNTSTDCRGLFQHMGRYWYSRAAKLPKAQFPRWPNSSAFNARANVWAAAQMVKAGGWGPWSTY